MVIIFSFLILLSLNSCKNSNSILGKWECKDSFSSSQYEIRKHALGYEMLIHYYDDGTQHFVSSEGMSIAVLQAKDSFFIDGISGETTIKHSEPKWKVKIISQDSLDVIRSESGIINQEIWRKYETSKIN